MGDLDPWSEEPSLHGNDSQKPPGTDDDDHDEDAEHALITIGGGSVLPLLSQKLITDTNSQRIFIHLIIVLWCTIAAQEMSRSEISYSALKLT